MENKIKKVVRKPPPPPGTGIQTQKEFEASEKIRLEKNN